MQNAITQTFNNNVIKNIIGIYSNQNKISNGLIIDKNGLFIIPNHIVKDINNKSKISHGRKFLSISSIIYQNESIDIAVGRINIPNSFKDDTKSSIVKIEFYNFELQEGNQIDVPKYHQSKTSAITSLNLSDRIKKHNKKFNDDSFYMTNLRLNSSYSGSPTVNSNNQITGIIICGTHRVKDRVITKIVTDPTYIVKSTKILEALNKQKYI